MQESNAKLLAMLAVFVIVFLLTLLLVSAGIIWAVNTLFGTNIEFGFFELVAMSLLFILLKPTVNLKR